MDFEGKIKNLGPSKLSLRVMQNIHSPNRFAVVIVIKHSLTVDNQEKVSHNLEETILHSLVKVCINC